MEIAMTDTAGVAGTFILAQAGHAPSQHGVPEGAVASEQVHGGPEGGHGGAFPPFDSSTFPGQLLWLAIFFGALYWLMSKVALPRVQNILEGRAEKISSDLAEAHRLKAETDAAIAAYEKALADARAEGHRIAAEMHDKVSAEAEERRRQTELALNAKLDEAEKQIAATKTAALGNVRGIAIEAGAAIVETLTGTPPAAPEIEQAVDASLAR
jgi:F-type H+-transporting ATPase subunit b